MGASAAWATTRPIAAGDRDSDAAGDDDEREPAKRPVDLLERTRHLHGDARGDPVGQDAQVDSRDGESSKYGRRSPAATCRAPLTESRRARQVEALVLRDELRDEPRGRRTAWRGGGR